MDAFADVEEHLTSMYRMIAVSMRYGHQQWDVLGEMEIDQVIRLNDALSYLIERENKAGSGLQNRHATGG